jgi:hypothetical protein
LPNKYHKVQLSSAHQNQSTHYNWRAQCGQIKGALTKLGQSNPKLGSNLVAPLFCLCLRRDWCAKRLIAAISTQTARNYKPHADSLEEPIISITAAAFKLLQSHGGCSSKTKCKFERARIREGMCLQQVVSAAINSHDEKCVMQSPLIAREISSHVLNVRPNLRPGLERRTHRVVDTSSVFSSRCN